MAKKATTTTSKINRSAQSLRNWNLSAAALHLIQGVVLLFIGKSITWPVTTNYLTANALASAAAGHTVVSPASHTLFNVNLAYLVAIFFFVAAIMHVVVATVYRPRYEADLKRGLNRVRWIEYGVSGGLMLIAIGLLSGVYDFSSLLMIFVLTLVMSLMGLMMEIRNQERQKPNWLSFWTGSLAGIIPWLVLAIYLWGTNIYGSGGVPTYVYFIFASLLALFVAFAVNMYLQSRRIGKWADYLYAERIYVVLGAVTKAALAWQIYAGALRR